MSTRFVFEFLEKSGDMNVDIRKHLKDTWNSFVFFIKLQ